VRELMTTAEVAEYLRLKERKLYELVRTRQIPCTRVAGKWLFPRRLIDLWVAEGVALKPRDAERAPPVVAGTHDPLLEWAMRESGCDLALHTGGSEDGLKRLADNRAVIAACHILEAESGTYNVAAARAFCPFPDLLLIEWAWRQQGLVVAAGSPLGLVTLADLARLRPRVICRQEGAGTQILFRQLLARAGIAYDDLDILAQPALTQTELATAILDGKADCGMAVEAAARRFRLQFLPLHRERVDLVMRRRDYFEPSLQSLLSFTRQPAFAAHAAELGGYDVANTGRVVFNG
jgi:putative molybdopterin biosynthesis protein